MQMEVLHSHLSSSISFTNPLGGTRTSKTETKFNLFHIGTPAYCNPYFIEYASNKIFYSVSTIKQRGIEYDIKPSYFPN